jgi:putative transposase
MKTARQKTAGEVKPRSGPRAKRIQSTGTRFTISDELWALMEPLLAEHKNTHRFGGGRPRVPDRQCAEGIFFVLRTGRQWNALSATGLCPSSTAHDRFQGWVEEGFFVRFWQAGLAEYDAFNGIDWTWLSMDGAMAKAALAGEKTRSRTRRTAPRAAPNALSWSRPAACRWVYPSPGRIATTSSSSLRPSKASRCRGPNLSPLRRRHLCLDKGYDFEEVRALGAALGFVAHIRSRGEETEAKARQPGQKARRWVVERTHGWMNRFRSLLIRWAKKPKNCLGLLQFVCGLIAYRAAGLFG